MDLLRGVRNHILLYWKSILLVILPIAFSPILFTSDAMEAKAGYVIMVVASFWMTEAMPLPAASLLPVVLFPMLGVMSTGKVCKAYLNETTMMFIGSLMLALTVEYCNLHKRVALKVLLHVGTSPRWLILGFMLTTMVLSMWISNTATTAMMVPIVDAVIRELYKQEDNEGDCKSSNPITIVPTHSTASIAALVSSQSSVSLEMSSSESDFSNKAKDPTKNGTEHEKADNMRKCALLAVCYASNIGGTATLIGTGSNLVLKGVFNELYEHAPSLNFAAWMAFNVPGMLINTFLAWIWLQFLLIGFKSSIEETQRAISAKKVLKIKYDDLGAMSFHEIATACLFAVCVVLWFFRDPQFIPGWAGYLGASVRIDDATTVVAIVVLLFVIPAQPKLWCRQDGGHGRKPGSALLDWDFVQRKMPWGVVLLLGGGFAVSDACKTSGLSSWIGSQLSGLHVLPPVAIMIVVCILTATVTEVASNAATTNILLPILSEMALAIQVNPLYLMIPATISCSYAFMLPVANSPNAIVYDASKMKPMDMIKAGFVLNIVCVAVTCVSMLALGDVMFQCDVFPDWALQRDTPQLVQTTIPLNCTLLQTN